MGKKKRSFKKKKPRFRGASGQIEVTRARIPQKRDGEMFGIVTQIFGGEHMRVRCEDGKERMGRIRGKIKKRMWTRLGDLVIVSPWDEMSQDDKCDIVHRYRRNEVDWLERKGYVSDLLNI